MVEAVARLGRAGFGLLRRVGRALRFALQLLGCLGVGLYRPRRTLRQLAAIIGTTFAITVVAGLVVGVLLVLRAQFTGAGLGGGSLVVAVAGPLVRELGPVLAALAFAARGASAWTAELGLMKAGEQLSALEMMGLDPLRRVFAPRFVAGVIAMPLLTALFCAAGIAAVQLFSVPVLALEPGALWAQLEAGVDPRADLAVGAIRSAAFGAAITGIALFEAHDCVPSAAGVSRATIRAVVNAALAVLALELVVTLWLARG